ncbi:TetR/AcrR family transcriptional regulator [Mycolicibacterium vinylchloridicum]|uniref:TetR/AcrR family transcriptional regulator n=1 Tax=Mycolicibacterium vinylchloridicum TaxID=2736928 RepID=UPI0015CEAE64|nr:TetR/AcrR family transcriptional regulator [Mycolicibacterium vinylchloridicum]
MTEPRAGLRERKKEDARRQIIHKANRLFRKHGYEGVTLEQIADACVMSVRTILRYFSTKEALALAVEHDLLESFRSRLANRDVDAVMCWREFQIDTFHLMETPEARARMIAIFSTPATLAEFSIIGQTYQDILADAIAEESGDVPPLETAVFATLLVSSSSAAFRRWLMYDEPFDIAVLNRNFDRVCAAFDERKPSRNRKVKSQAAKVHAR